MRMATEPTLHPRWNVTLLTLLFGAEVVPLDILQAPAFMRLVTFACSDSGANLVAPHLLARGLRPAVDFGYIYGLLPLLLGRIWFGLFGTAPIAYQAACTVCGLLIAWALARISVRLRLGWIGIALIVASMPFTVRPMLPNLTHALEAAILANALAEQLASRRAALALATAACFTKPSMGYIYGLLLLVLIALDLRNRNQLTALSFARMLLPAFVTGVALTIVLVAVYGPMPLVHTLSPAQGVAMYRALNFGFFSGTGHRYLYFPGARPGYYLGDFVALWALAGLWLLGAAIAESTRLRDNPAAELVITCAIMHVMFVAVFYGHPASWTYYSYLLTIGIVATSVRRSMFTRSAVASLAALAMVSTAVYLRTVYRQYREAASVARIDQLWATRAEVDEWTQVLALAEGHPTVALHYAGATELLSPAFEPPTALFMVPAEALPQELQREADQLESAARIVVCVNSESGRDWYRELPFVGQAMRGTRLEFSGPDFEVFSRARNPR